MTNTGGSPEPRRRLADLADETQSRWRFSKTISLDSIVVLAVTIISGLVFLLSMQAKVDQQARDLAYVQKSVERVEADQKERAARLERDTAERALRLESAIKDQNKLIQDYLVPRLQR